MGNENQWRCPIIWWDFMFTKGGPQWWSTGLMLYSRVENHKHTATTDNLPAVFCQMRGQSGHLGDSASASQSNWALKLCGAPPPFSPGTLSLQMLPWPRRSEPQVRASPAGPWHKPWWWCYIKSKRIVATDAETSHTHTDVRSPIFFISFHVSGSIPL